MMRKGQTDPKPKSKLTGQIDVSNIIALAGKELRDARKDRWFVTFAAAFAVLALALSWLGFSSLRLFRHIRLRSNRR